MSTRLARMTSTGARVWNLPGGFGGAKSTATMKRNSWSGRDTDLTILSQG